MAEQDQSSKTEQPTSKRLREAHKEGNFPQSQEIGTVFVLAAAFLVLAFLAKQKSTEMALLASAVFSNLTVSAITVERTVDGLRYALHATLFLLAPVLIGTVIGAVLAGGMQSGFRLTAGRLEPNLAKFNPVNGMKKLFNAQSAVQLATDLLKFIAIGAILYGLIREIMSDDIFHSPVPPSYLGEFLFEISLLMLARLIIAIGVIAILNYLYQRHKVRKDLMMTRQEVKDERKNAEGNPEVKSAQRHMARQILQKQMLKSIPLADVVVTNSTHFAVALKYEQGRNSAPVVVAKGMNLFALRIIDIANRHGVPRIENRGVAQMLYRLGRVGESIPVELYEVVASILAHVYRLHRYYFHRLKARRLGQ